MASPCRRPRQLRRGGGPPRFRRISPLAAPPGPGVGCKQRFKPGGSSGLDSQLLGTILRPFPTILADLGPCPAADTLTPCHFIFFGFSATRHGTVPIGSAPRFWTWGWYRFEKLPYGCRDMAISMCLASSMFLRHRESVVETGQMSSVETRQMSQQQSSVLSQQQTSVLSQQTTSILSQLVLARTGKPLNVR